MASPTPATSILSEKATNVHVSAPSAKACVPRKGSSTSKRVYTRRSSSNGHIAQRTVVYKERSTVVVSSKSSDEEEKAKLRSRGGAKKEKKRNVTRELSAFFADLKSYFARVDRFELQSEDGDDDDVEERAMMIKKRSGGGEDVEGVVETKVKLSSVAEEERDERKVKSVFGKSRRASSSSSMGMSRRLSLVLQAKDGDRDTPLRRKLSFTSRTSTAAVMTPSRLSFGGATESSADDGASATRMKNLKEKEMRKKSGAAFATLGALDEKSEEEEEEEEAQGETLPGATATILEEDEGETDDVDESSIGLSGIALLMKACEQDCIKSPDAAPSLHDFVSSFVAPASPEAAATAPKTNLRKIGEGTFGEAFRGADGSVFKVVPIEGSMLVNGELQKSAEDIIPEVVVARSLSSLRVRSRTSSEVSGAFVELRGSAVCRGAYPPELLDAWHAWDAENTSENDCPSVFGADQHYIVFVFADGGRDLERFKVNTFAEARSIILQTAMALAVAEASCRFEHRDLHWGNVLVTRTAGGDGDVHDNEGVSDGAHAESTSASAFQSRLNGVDVDIFSAGVKVTLIDFTLSRIDNGADCAFCDLSLDPELFKGPARDPQADCYRRMKKITKNDWSTHCPKTNVVWLQYLSEVMLSMKDVALSAIERKELKSFKRRAGGYASAVEVVWDDFFKGSWQSSAATE